MSSAVVAVSRMTSLQAQMRTQKREDEARGHRNDDSQHDLSQMAPERGEIAAALDCLLPETVLMPVE